MSIAKDNIGGTLDIECSSLVFCNIAFKHGIANRNGIRTFCGNGTAVAVRCIIGKDTLRDFNGFHSIDVDGAAAVRRCRVTFKDGIVNRDRFRPIEVDRAAIIVSRFVVFKRGTADRDSPHLFKVDRAAVFGFVTGKVTVANLNVAAVVDRESAAGFSFVIPERAAANRFAAINL